MTLQWSFNLLVSGRTKWILLSTFYLEIRYIECLVGKKQDTLYKNDKYLRDCYQVIANSPCKMLCSDQWRLINTVYPRDKSDKNSDLRTREPENFRTWELEIWADLITIYSIVMLIKFIYGRQTFHSTAVLVFSTLPCTSVPQYFSISAP